MTVTEHDEAAERPRPLDGLVKLGLVVLLAIETIDELAHAWRRVSKATSSWWEGVEHRERRQLHDAEVGFLLRRAGRR